MLLLDAFPVGLAGGLAFGLTFGPVFGLTGGPVSVRYLALLILTRRSAKRRLPWRLSHFLAWCYDAGLIRTAGTAYQFRHRELQDYLARQPGP